MSRNGPSYFYVSVFDQEYLFLVGGQRDYNEMVTDVMMIRMQPSFDDCSAKLFNRFWTQNGEYRDYIQEHIMLVDKEEPVVCGGIVGDFDEEQTPVGAQCYKPFFNIDGGGRLGKQLQMC